jgi:hypothetical protein
LHCHSETGVVCFMASQPVRVPDEVSGVPGRVRLLPEGLRQGRHRRGHRPPAAPGRRSGGRQSSPPRTLRSTPAGCPPQARLRAARPLPGQRDPGPRQPRDSYNPPGGGPGLGLRRPRRSPSAHPSRKRACNLTRVTTPGTWCECLERSTCSGRRRPWRLAASWEARSAGSFGCRILPDSPGMCGSDLCSCRRHGAGHPRAFQPPPSWS